MDAKLLSLILVFPSKVTKRLFKRPYLFVSVNFIVAFDCPKCVFRWAEIASAHSKPALEGRGLNMWPAGRRKQPSRWLHVAARQSEDICTDQHTPEILTSDKPAGCRCPCMFSQIRTQKWGEPVPLEWSDPTTGWQMETGSWTNLAEMALQWPDSSQVIQGLGLQPGLFGLCRFVSTVHPTFLSPCYCC